MSTIPADDAVLGHMIDSYIKLRDKKEAIKKQQDEVLKQYSDAMEQIEDFLRGLLKRQQISSISCDAGTAFLRRKRSATVADMGSFREFIISNENFDLADFRANVEAVEGYLGEHEGQLPPGVNFSTFEAVSVQRK